MVDTTGKVVFVRVGQALRGCTVEAIKCVRQWKFQPATFNGKPIPVFYTVTVNFELR